MHVKVGELADALHQARKDRRTIEPVASRQDGWNLANAYATQAAGLSLRLEEGEEIAGGKLGFTSQAMQQAMGVDHPNYGWLTDAMLVRDETIRLERLIHPKVEPEIAFWLGADLVQPVTAEAVLEATEAFAACLEIVDSRYHHFKFGLADNVADNSSAALVVLGPRVPLQEVDLATLRCTLSRDGEPVAHATGAAALGDPAEAVAWMANHAESPLEAGHLVLSGGLTPPLDLHAGDAISVDFDRLGRATCNVE